MSILTFLTNAFPLWVLLSSVTALLYPSLFTWFKPYITLGLGMIMLGMGLTLSFDDFYRIRKFPSWIGAGILFQYIIMPPLGWFLGRLFQLPLEFSVGLILVSCCPGGTASNVIAYLARANVALSVSMTAISTLLAVLMTPLLTTWLADSRIDVNSWGLLLNTFQVVVLPVAAGVALNRFMHKWTQKISHISPLCAVIFIVLIVAAVIGDQKEIILTSGISLLGAIFTLHMGGFVIGYLISKILFKNEVVARTISIEVGMQNSGLGVVLARNNFNSPLVAVPSAISSIFHCLIGSVAASFWRRRA